MSYSSVPTSSEPYIEGFTIGNSHAVTVIVDENSNTNNRNGARSNAGSQTPNVSPLFLDGSRKPVQLSMCPACSQKHVQTRTVTYPSAVTWFSVVVGAIVFLPICWIPLVVDPMKQTDHYCQNCGKKVGTVKALDGCCVKEQM